MRGIDKVARYMNKNDLFECKVYIYVGLCFPYKHTKGKDSTVKEK